MAAQILAVIIFGEFGVSLWSLVFGFGFACGEGAGF